MPRSPLFEQYAGMQPTLMDYHGWTIPSSFGSVEEEYWALREGAGLMDLSHRGRLLVQGEDAPRFLHGMVSNEVKGLEVGQGNYAFVLDPRGHILADVRVLRLDAETFLLDCEPQLLEVIRQELDHHIIADAVELEDRTAQLACVAVEGPRAGEVLRHALGFDPPPRNDPAEAGSFRSLEFALRRPQAQERNEGGSHGPARRDAVGFWPWAFHRNKNVPTA